MASIRQEQVASLIKQHLGDVFIKDGRGIYGGAFVTITNVRMTPDLMIARIYLSVYNVEDKQEVVDIVESQNYLVRKLLGQRIRNKVRRIPELEFYLDDTLDEVFRMGQLFDKLREDEGKEADKEEEE